MASPASEPPATAPNALLSLSSIASKSLLDHGQLPIAIVTSLFGVPFLLALVLQRKAADAS